MQESGVNELPGNPANGEGAQEGDDDYYWAGDYSTVIAGNGDYTPLGLVEANEESAERAFAGVDNDLRYHFNLPDTLKATDKLTVSYDALNLHGGEADSRYGIEVYFNNVQVQSEIVIREAELGQTFTTEPFTLADVNAEVGSGYDNIITLKGVNYNAEGGGNWMGIDYVELTKAPGLVAHFPLDSDGDSSDGGFKASKVTDVTFGAAGANGATGTSASFNGSSSVIQHDWSADLNPEGSFTLALWARSDGGAGAWNSPVTSRHDLYNEGEASQGYLIYDNNPSGVWTFWSGNGDVAGNWQILDGPAVNIGEWDHLAIVYDSEAEMKKLYVNGALEAESNDIVAPNDTTPLNIGAGADYGGTFWFEGDIDDIGLWNLALSQEEIQDVMNNGVVPVVGDAPALSIVNNGDGTVTVTFEGRLEAAASVNGPWQDTGATSPLTTPADAAMQYARAVKD